MGKAGGPLSSAAKHLFCGRGSPLPCTAHTKRARSFRGRAATGAGLHRVPLNTIVPRLHPIPGFAELGSAGWYRICPKSPADHGRLQACNAFGQKPSGNGERAAPGLQSDPPGGAPPRSGGEALLEAVITRPALFMG